MTLTTISLGVFLRNVEDIEDMQTQELILWIISVDRRLVFDAENGSLSWLNIF